MQFRLFSIFASFVVVMFSGCVIESSRNRADHYEGCDRSSDCTQEADGCFEVAYDGARGKMCSTSCDDDRDCVYGGACYALDGDTAVRRICYARCDPRHSGLDCPTGFECNDAIVGDEVVDHICMPER